nr:MAG TPA: hypothetical protein [Caudoviricetes sp.]
MKCPYLIKQVLQDIWANNEAGNNGKTIQALAQVHTDCIKEQCAAWRDSQCKYNAKK